MITLVIEKELRDIISSAKFIISFVVCAVLILLTFYVGAKNYQVSVARFEAAKAENLRKMEGLTDWMRVGSHRIFLPPRPLEALVSGVSNDIGRTIEMRGRGELTSVDSRYSEDPIFAIFRFLDLEFIFQIILSLFAVLLAFDAINGEKERGTLRLTFANKIPRDKFILGKLLGAFISIGIPLLIPIVLGCLLLPALDVTLSGDEMLRLGMVILSGLLYFSAFLILSVFISALTHRSSTSFLILLVIWIFAVLIIPRTSVLLAGRAIDVPTVDELSYQKGRFRAQLWHEDADKMAQFKPKNIGDPQAMAQEFNKFMQELSDERNKKIEEYTNRLNDRRASRQGQQERFAFAIARISPSAVFSLAATALAGTSIDQKQQFINEASGYQQTYSEFMKEKTGMSLGGDMILFRVRSGGDEEEEEKPIDPKELPEFIYRALPLARIVHNAIVDIALLLLYNLIFFIGAFVGFLRYDLR